MPAKAKQKTVTAYVVHRFDWRYSDEFYYKSNEDGFAIKTFLVRDKAEAYRRDKERAEREARGYISPLEMNDLEWEAQTSLTPAQVRERLLAVGLDAPADENGYWDWWQNGERRWTDEQRHAAWDAFDKARFFEVVEMRIEIDE